MKATPPAIAAATALPAWLKVSLRPIRAVKARWPTIPSDTAASAGGKITSAAFAMPCETATGQKLGNNGSSTDETVTISAAATISNRFALVASMSALAGVCAAMPATVATDITMPMRASSHC